MASNFFMPEEPTIKLSPGDELILAHAAGIPIQQIIGVAEWRLRERELIVLGLLTEDGKDITQSGASLLTKTSQARKRAQVLAAHGATNGKVPGRTIPQAN